MNELRELGERYLKVRRAMGFKLVDTELHLKQYFRFLEEHRYPGQSLKNTVEWAASGGASAGVQATRLSIIRVFVRWARSFNTGFEPIPEHLGPSVKAQAVPYIYTPEQIAALMGQASLLPQCFRAATYWTALGLLACTGMRVGEVIRLNKQDVEETLIHIVESKFGKSRFIPVDPSTVQILERYAQLREKEFPAASTGPFFVSLRGTRLIYQNVQRTVHGLVRAAGIEASSLHHRPRIHDLRHTFATNTMADAYRLGRNPAQILPILATYLGHVQVESTYWYLQSEPGLLGAAADRLPALMKSTGPA
ncbi:site-specific integrase [Arthrobacter pigmenti]